MKKAILILSIYALIIFLILLGGVYFFHHLPPLVPGMENRYRMTGILLGFLTLLPPVSISGFAVACAATWKKYDSKNGKRFSPAMFNRLKGMFPVIIGLILILSLSEEIFIPSVKNRFEKFTLAPAELADAIETSETLLDQGRPYLALQYAKKAYEIHHGSESAVRLMKLAQDAVDIEHDRKLYKKLTKGEKVVKPIHDEHRGYTILQLLDRSREAQEKKQWFEAHYWAQLAVDACDGTNTNLSAATQAANYAWNQLNKPVEFDNSEERDYYRTKRKGYKAFVMGDSLKAYYTFLGLDKSLSEHERDPDVKRFLALAKEDVENQYFFFDETENMKELADSRDVYFSLDYPDGTTNVFYIAKTMDIKRNGGLVRYLENFNVIHYDANGSFRYSFKVPYAKVTAQPVSEFGDNLGILGIEKNWKSVPVVTLQSVDRTTEGLISRPVYSYKRSGLPKKVLDDLGMWEVEITDSDRTVTSLLSVPKSAMMVLPMPFSDFHLINEASSGAEKMNLLSLNKFLPDAVKYGFSKEVFTENLVQRITYPFIIFVFLLIAACMGWNYRIDNPKQLFCFRWIFLIPIFGTMTLFIYSAFKYMFSMMNYVFVSFFGLGSVLIAVVFYIVLIFGIAVIFVSRRS